MDEDVWNSTSNDAHHDRKLKERQWTLAIEEGHISNAYFKSLAPNPTTCVHPSCNEWATVACAVCTNSGTPIGKWCEEHARQFHEENFLVHVLLLTSHCNYQCEHVEGSHACEKPAYFRCGECSNRNLCKMHGCEHPQSATEFLNYVDLVAGGCVPFDPPLVLHVVDESRRDQCEYSEAPCVSDFLIECWTLHGMFF